MKHFFEKCGSLLLLALAAVILLFAFSPAADAASTRYSDYSLIYTRVDADPGEDPHLKVISGIEDYSVINYQELSSESLSSGDRQEMLRGHGSGDSGAVRWHSRVNPKLTVIMQAFFLTLRR
ncbi:MAG: hypothetical protein JW746_00880 [Candidatus Krumholzibacteriota bacterium]|nr:hypothetical protein [Candidatus Krumholzibacteriota bacterium]